MAALDATLDVRTQSAWIELYDGETKLGWFAVETGGRNPRVHLNLYQGMVKRDLGHDKDDATYPYVGGYWAVEGQKFRIGTKIVAHVITKEDTYVLTSTYGKRDQLILINTKTGNYFTAPFMASGTDEDGPYVTKDALDGMLGDGYTILPSD